MQRVTPRLRHTMSTALGSADVKMRVAVAQTALSHRSPSNTVITSSHSRERSEIRIPLKSLPQFCYASQAIPQPMNTTDTGGSSGRKSGSLSKRLESRSFVLVPRSAGSQMHSAVNRLQLLLRRLSQTPDHTPRERKLLSDPDETQDTTVTSSSVHTDDLMTQSPPGSLESVRIHRNRAKLSKRQLKRQRRSRKGDGTCVIYSNYKSLVTG